MNKRLLFLAAATAVAMLIGMHASRSEAPAITAGGREKMSGRINSEPSPQRIQVAYSLQCKLEPSSSTSANHNK